MINKYITLFLCIGVLGFISCKENDIEKEQEQILIGGKFKPIIVETIGLDVTPSSNGFKLEGSIPADGLSFTIVPAEQFKSKACVTRVIINDEKLCNKTDFSGEPPYLEETPVLNGDWGEIRHIKASHSIEIKINKNNINALRIFDIQIGWGYEYVRLRLIQQIAENKIY